MDEAYSSVTCSLCGGRHRSGWRHRGLYICRVYGRILNADVNAVANLVRGDIPRSLFG